MYRLGTNIGKIRKESGVFLHRERPGILRGAVRGLGYVYTRSCSILAILVVLRTEHDQVYQDRLWTNMRQSLFKK